MASILSAGTSSGTALNLSGDTSGILQLASNNGTVGLTMDTSQNVGIGTSSPSSYAPLTVRKYIVSGSQNNAASFSDAVNATLNIGFTSGFANFVCDAGQAFYTSSAERMRIDSSGNVGIGTTATGTKLNVLLGTSYTIGSNWNSSVATFGQATSSGGIAGGALGVSFDTTNGATLSSLNPGVSWYQMQLAGTYIAFRTGGSATEAARIDSSGNLLVGTTLGYAKFFVSQDNPNATVFFNTGTGAGGSALGLRSNINTVGQTNINIEYQGSTKGSIVTNGSTTAFNTSSDYRLKENVQLMSGGLSTVLQLKPVTYDWISDKSKGQGFIAHELQEIVPDCVTGEKDAVDEEGKPIYQGVDTSFLVATLTAAIQEQQALITTLQTQVAALQAKVGA